MSRWITLFLLKSYVRYNEIMNIIKTILRLIFGHSRSPYFTGVTKDPRTLEAQKKDYVHEERTAPAIETPSIWSSMIIESPYFYENQLFTSSCVAHGVLLPFSILLKRIKGTYYRLSQMFVYRPRSNFPALGMSPWEAFEYIRKNGSCLFETLPTPQTEADADALVITPQMKTEAQIFTGAEYYTFTTTKNDINALATVAAQGYAVSICIYASYREWAQLFPTIIDNPSFNTAEIRHEISILPNGGFISDGIKYVAIQDSAWFAGLKIRYLSEAFIKARVYDARYWTTVTMMAGAGIKPTHIFTIPLSIGAQGPEVVALQKCLIFEGLLPVDCATGLFAGRTLAAVKVFQEKYKNDILLPSNLNAATGYVGLNTIKKLNALYGV
jgi:peptidoglycan hydrolase-like protein with peptidoglycan-binding domain